MGKYRSKHGCLTCRTRRVKCDEVHPICGQCIKKSRDCQWEAPHTRFKEYLPGEASSITGAGGGGEGESDQIDVEDDGDGGGDEEEMEMTESRSPERADARDGFMSSHSPALTSRVNAQQQHQSFRESPDLLDPGPTSSAGGISVVSPNPPQYPLDPRYLETPITLTRHEAYLVHYYTERLGFWLDCTDGSRQFTLRIPERVKRCPVLFYAVVSFAARHHKDTKTAEQAYQHCIALLIDRLNENTASHDENLLSAIVILRFYEQLNVPPATGSDNEQHLSGCSAILRASQGLQYVDPSAPTLREAAFWVYVRQCLYNATINQQSPDLDFSLQLQPTPDVMRDHHPLAQLRIETAWANQITWTCACVINFCFEGSGAQTERGHRTQRWQELWDRVENWGNERCSSFDPIWSGPPANGSAFPEIWFTSDWHMVSFGFYHFSRILLLSYKPGPKFAIRNVGGKLSDSDKQILKHARAICGSCKSSPDTVPNLIVLCHTIFIWGPLISAEDERNEIIQMLSDFEKSHMWPTMWIINALKTEWGLD